MVHLPTFETPETKALMDEIVRKSNGVCFVGFSGKDSLCCLLYCLTKFRRVIPFHAASYPMLKSKERMLQYYEREIGETIPGFHILRMVGEELSMGLARLAYQYPDEVPALMDAETPDWSKLDLVEFLRAKMSLPKAWCAFGMNVNDSIDRRIYCKKVEGRNPQNYSFYPCWNWPKAAIIQTLKESGLKLSEEYLWQNRSLGSAPSATCEEIYREHLNEDWNRVMALYPLLIAKTYREMMLNAAWQKRRDMGIIDDEPVGDGGEFDDGTDVMPELGMGVDESGEGER